jgi:Leucine-rich repeat (LRR) protein
MDVSSNRLRRLPADLGWLSLRQLDLSGNVGLQSPGKAVLAKGLRAVLSYQQASPNGLRFC